MNSENELLGYGQFLKQIRCEKDISLASVSEITKISEQMLELLEAEADEELPEELFVRNFIRRYANAVGVDENEALSWYSGQSDVSKSGFDKKKSLPLIGKLLWVCVIPCIILVSVVIGWVVISLSDSVEKVPESQSPKQEILPADEEKRKDTVTSDTYSIYGNENALEKQWVLHVKAVEKTWMKIIVDGQSPIEYMLESNEEIILEAKTGFDLLIGNAGGIQLELNGTPVNVPGRSGQVASLKIP